MRTAIVGVESCGIVENTSGPLGIVFAYVRLEKSDSVFCLCNEIRGFCSKKMSSWLRLDSLCHPLTNHANESKVG